MSAAKTSLRIDIRSTWESFQKEAYKNQLISRGARFFQMLLDATPRDQKMRWVGEVVANVPSAKRWIPMQLARREVVDQAVHED